MAMPLRHYFVNVNPPMPYLLFADPSWKSTMEEGIVFSYVIIHGFFYLFYILRYNFVDNNWLS